MSALFRVRFVRSPVVGIRKVAGSSLLRILFMSATFVVLSFRSRVSG